MKCVLKMKVLLICQSKKQDKSMFSMQILIWIIIVVGPIWDEFHSGFSPRSPHRFFQTTSASSCPHNQALLDRLPTLLVNTSSTSHHTIPAGGLQSTANRPFKESARMCIMHVWFRYLIIRKPNYLPLKNICFLSWNQINVFVQTFLTYKIIPHCLK